MRGPDQTTSAAAISVAASRAAPSRSSHAPASPAADSRGRRAGADPARRYGRPSRCTECDRMPRPGARAGQTKNAGRAGRCSPGRRPRSHAENLVRGSQRHRSARLTGSCEHTRHRSRSDRRRAERVRVRRRCGKLPRVGDRLREGDRARRRRLARHAGQRRALAAEDRQRPRDRRRGLRDAARARCRGAGAHARDAARGWHAVRVLDAPDARHPGRGLRRADRRARARADACSRHTWRRRARCRDRRRAWSPPPSAATGARSTTSCERSPTTSGASRSACSGIPRTPRTRRRRSS